MGAGRMRDVKWALEWRAKELRRRLPSGVQRALKPLLPRGVEHVDPPAASAAPAARAAVSARSDAALVLCYHRVALAEDDPYELGVRPERFAAQLDWIQAQGRIVPLDEITRRGRGLRVAITFDDGYADNFVTAYPLLEERSAPATVFVVSGSVGAAREFWIDETRQLVLDPPLERRELTVAGVAVRGATPRELYTGVCDVLRPLPDAEIARELAALEEQVGRTRTVRGDYRPLTEDELLRLAATGLVTIGAHTIDHPTLPAQSGAVQLRQLEESRRALETLLDR